MAGKLLVVMMVVAVSAVVARPDEVKDELSNVISQSDAAPDPSPAAATPHITVPQIRPLTTDAPAVTGNTQRTPGAGFTGLIDDIFQIPISVLKAVNKLLTNPFREQQQSS